MSSQTLKILAVAMIIGSVMLAIIGLRISRAPEVPPSAEQSASGPPKVAVPKIVVAARPISSGMEIGDGDVALASIDPEPSNVFRNPKEVVGKRPVTAIAAGSPVLRSHFSVGNPLAAALREDERAVAVKVSNLIGVGGFLRPGDMVDVLLYLRGDNQKATESRSLVVVRSVRVLAYGSELGSAEDAGKNEKTKSKDAGTAVLAVSARDAVRLNLAENAGVLRLALRPASMAETGFEDLDSIRLSEISVPGPEDLALKKPKGPMVEVFRGGQRSIIQFP